MELSLYSIFLVGSGGGLGAALRFLLGQHVPFPFGTMLVNVIGSFCIGLLFVSQAHKISINSSLFVTAGFLGGFTTFSAFSLDVLKLVDTGKGALAFAYVLTTVVASVAAVFLGALLARL